MSADQSDHDDGSYLGGSEQGAPTGSNAERDWRAIGSAMLAHWKAWIVAGVLIALGVYLLSAPGETGTRTIHELFFVAAGLASLAYGAWRVHDEANTYGGAT